MPFLYLAQKQNDNWIPLAAIKYIANLLSMPYISVYEVATFYSMYNLAPVGNILSKFVQLHHVLFVGQIKLLRHVKKKFLQTKTKFLK